MCPSTKPLHMLASIIWCLSLARINWEGCSRKGILCKMGDEGGGGTGSPDGVVSVWTVGVSASVIFSCTKSPEDGEQW